MTETHGDTTLPLATLVASHRAFLAFVQRKLGDRALAEDVLQSAFVRSLERQDQLRDRESAVAWFYRMLRNAVIDHQRHDRMAARRLESFAQELALAPQSASPADRDEICACLLTLAEALPAEQARALRRVDLEGVAVKDYAVEAGITANNAGVRLFRARARLREALTNCCGTCADHGCRDCTCSSHDHDA
ncbi:MAG: sigma-70 family RNA polymerase sigma factor [Nannocystaceae bacterium]|nr:sigma-70 family RNA polymerase sigma factor [Nannocystaceae bacterium]